jgi:hypothetical protein
LHPQAPLWSEPAVGGVRRGAVSEGRVDRQPAGAYPELVEVTISIDDELFDRAQRLARRREMSLQELIREQLRLLAAEHRSDAGRELLALMASHGGRSGGQRWRREDAYAGRV